MIYDGALAADGVFEYRKMGVVSGNRSIDHCVDSGRDYQSWQGQYHCDGSFVYPDTGTLQGNFLSVERQEMWMQVKQCPLAQQ